MANPAENRTASLRRDVLSEDMSSLKDTVAELAKVFAAEIGEAASGIGAEVASSAKEQAGSMVAEFERVARRNPLAVVAGALCVGLVIGLISGRR